MAARSFPAEDATGRNVRRSITAGVTRFQLMAWEEEFKVQISDEDAEKITTVQEAEDYIEEHLR